MTAAPFLQTTINRPVATQAAQIVIDGQFTTSAIPFQSFGPQSTVIDALTETLSSIEFDTAPISLEVIANGGPLTFTPLAGVRKPIMMNVQSNSGQFSVTDQMLWSGAADTLNVFHNSGTINIDYNIAGSTSAFVGLAHRINVLANSGTINVSDAISSGLPTSSNQTQINVGTTSSVSPGTLTNIHGALNLLGLSTSFARTGLLVDDRSGSGTPASWTLGSSQTQIGDFTITYGPPDSEFPYALRLFERFWRAGTQVTSVDFGPAVARYNGSVNFPLAWGPPPNGLFNFEGDTVNRSLNNFSVPPSAAVTYAATNLPTGLSLNSSTGLITGTIPVGASVLAPFETQFTVTAGDYTVIRHSDWAVQGSISIDFFFSTPADFDEGNSVYLGFYTSNSAPRPVTVTVSGVPAWLTYNPAAKEFTGTVPVGASVGAPYRVTVRGEDGVSATEVEFDVLVSSTAFASVPAVRLNRTGDTVDIPIQASTTSGRALTYSATGLPAGISINAATGRLIGTITSNVTQRGTYSAFVSASDGVTTRGTVFGWNVLPLGIADEIIFTSPGPQLSKEGQGAGLFVSARSSLVLPLSYTAQGLPPGFTISDTGYLSGIFGPTAATGSPYNVTVTASDGFYTSSTTFDWNVVPANAITVQNPGPLNNFVNTAVNRQIVASTTSGLPLTYSATGLPTGLSINAQTGLISGTVAFLSAMPGIFNTHVTVTDGASTYGTMLQWTITNGPNQPHINRLALPGGGTFMLFTAAGTQLSTSITTDPGVARPGGIQFPFGFLDFEILALNGTVLPPGAATTLTITGPSFAQTDKYYKYGPTPANPTPHWYNFLYNVQTDADNATGTGMQLFPTTIVLRLIDGGRGDNDLTRNGVVRDLGGPAFAVPALPGDFNVDGRVDGADYVVWRKLGMSASAYTTWRQNFGATAENPGAAASSTFSAETHTPIAPPTSEIMLQSSVNSSTVDNDAVPAGATPADQALPSINVDFDLHALSPAGVPVASAAKPRTTAASASDVRHRDELLALYQAGHVADELFGSFASLHVDLQSAGDVSADDFAFEAVDDIFDVLNTYQLGLF